MSLEPRELASVLDAPQPHSAVVRSCGERRAVRTDCHAEDRPHEALQKDHCAGLEVPQPNRAEPVTERDTPVVRVKRDSRNESEVVAQVSFLRRCDEVPHLHRPIAASRREQGAVAAERERHHAPGMACDRAARASLFDVPDDGGLVSASGDQAGVVAAEGHCQHGTPVTAKNSLLTSVGAPEAYCSVLSARREEPPRGPECKGPQLSGTRSDGLNRVIARRTVDDRWKSPDGRDGGDCENRRKPDPCWNLHRLSVRLAATSASSSQRRGRGP